MFQLVTVTCITSLHWGDDAMSAKISPLHFDRLKPLWIKSNWNAIVRTFLSLFFCGWSYFTHQVPFVYVRKKYHFHSAVANIDNSNFFSSSPFTGIFAHMLIKPWYRRIFALCLFGWFINQRCQDRFGEKAGKKFAALPFPRYISLQWTVQDFSRHYLKYICRI